MPNAEKGIPKNIEPEFAKDSALCLYAIAGSLGYLHAHLEEVKRLKAIILDIDAIMKRGALNKAP